MANKKTSSKQALIEKRRAEKQRKQRMQYLGLAAILVIVILVMAWAFTSNKAAAGPLPLDVPVEQAYELVQDGAFLLDVRTQEEWDESHAPMATLIPLDQLADRVSELPQDQDIVVICRSGNRSQEGRDILLAAGFARVTSSNGGLIDWQAAGYPVE